MFGKAVVIPQNIRAYQLPCFRTTLYVSDQLLLLLLELCPLPIQFALRLREGSLMLAKPLRWGDCPSK